MIDFIFRELPGIFHAGLLIAAPLLWAAFGGLYSERSGVINVGLEGMMLTGAFAGAAGAWVTGNPWIGLLCGAVCGGVLGLLHAWICLYWKANQIVSGMGINLLAYGGTGFLLYSIFQTRGNSPQITKIPLITGWDGIPFFSPLLFPLSPLHLLLALMTLLTLYVYYRTRYGLRIRACGENPDTVLAAGIHVNRYRYSAVIISGVLAGIGGVQLSISDISQFSTGMSDGRGFIALAALISSGWKPRRLILICLCFGVLAALGERLQPVFPQMSPRVFLLMPFLLALCILAFRSGSTQAPEALGTGS